MRISLFNKSGVEHATEQVGDSAFPIVKTDTTLGRLFDPRADYDPINDRLWYFYSEDNRRRVGGSGDIARVHIGVSVKDAMLDELDDTDWHRYTGDPAPGTAAGTAFDLGDIDIGRYQGAMSGHDRLRTLFDLPSLAFDERAMVMCGYSDEVFDRSTVLVVIPYEHDGGAKSILDGDRPDESDITIIRLDDLLAEDESNQNYAVQEPHDQAGNASFYIGS